MHQLNVGFRSEHAPGSGRIVDDLERWVNGRGAEVLEWMYDLLPIMVIAAMAAAALAYWASGVFAASRRG